MDVATISVANNFIDSLPVETDSTVYSVVVNVNLFDTVDVQNIEVKIGTTAGGSDLVNQTFAFDVSGSLSGGMSYLRELYRVQLGVGNLIGLGDYYAEVRVQRLDGSYSPSVVFNR
ncbi:MAG: hypothetical protein IPP51_15545 [Bacteroidetes bacterium]|nr:hypothetical protein [Bacteroidota bacterium]